MASNSEYLFHYTSNNTAIEHILDTGKLRLSPLSNVNDPRESLDWTYQVKTEQSLLLDFGLFDKINDEINTSLKANVKILCMSQDFEPPVDKPVHKEFYNGYARSRMWAQYAGNHTGVCLAFDKEKLKQALIDDLGSSDLVHSGPVRYTNSVSSDKDGFSFSYKEYQQLGVQKATEEKFNRLKRVYFFTKNEDWSSEQEFRILIKIPEPGHKLFDFKDSLRHIYLGHLFPRAYLPLINRFAEKYDVIVSRISWHNGYPTAMFDMSAYD